MSMKGDTPFAHPICFVELYAIPTVRGIYNVHL